MHKKFVLLQSLLDWLPDTIYLRIRYLYKMKRILHLEHPVTFSEKLQYLKVHDRRDIYCSMVDKYQAKNIAAAKIGTEHIIPTYGVWDSFDEIDFEKLPKSFVLKATHDCGGVVVVKDKQRLDLEQARTILEDAVQTDYYKRGREWPYKNVAKRILAEAYLDGGEEGLTDYKVHVFSGSPRLVLVCKNRFAKEGMTMDFFTDRWEHLSVSRPGKKHAANCPEKPALLDEMLAFSAILAADIPFLRTDFYIHENQIYFGEFTFYPASGFENFDPESFDWDLGSLINIKDI